MAFNLKFNFMKNILFTLTILFSLNTFSQGNLQFNRVVNLEIKQKLPISINNTTGGPGGKNVLETIVIPENKVWKIIAVSARGYDEYRQDEPPGDQFIGNNNGNITITMNGTFIWQTQAAYFPNMNTFPIWINEGSKDLIAWNYFKDRINLMLSISAIEFNIVD